VTAPFDEVEFSDPTLNSSAEIRRRALVGVFSVSVRGFGIRMLGLFGYLACARLLTPEDFGLAALGLTITFAAHFLADAGIGAALLRSPDEPRREDYAAVVGVQFTLLMAITLGFVGWAVLSGSKTAIITCLFVASLPMLTFRVPAGISLERQLRFGPSIRADLSEVLVYNVWIIAGAAAGYGVYALATGAIVKTIVGAVVINRLAPIGWVRPRLDLRRVRPLLRFGMTFQATSGVALLRDQAINIGTALIAGYAVLGLWSIAARITSVPLLIFDSLMRVSFPTMSRLRTQGDDVRESMVRHTRRFTILSGFVLVPASVAAPVLLPLVLGHQWNEATTVVPFVFFGVMVSQPISVVASGFLLAAGDAQAVLRVSIAILIAQVAVTAVALPVLGFIGMGIGYVAAAIADGAVLSMAVHRHNGVRLFRTTLPAALAFALSVAVGLALVGDGDNVVLGGLGVLASVLLFAALMFAMDRNSVKGLVSLISELPTQLRAGPGVAPKPSVPVEDAT
jgi:O-antigen/teichoic acid export membrane protein